MKTSHHASGKKVSGKHTTLTAPAKKVFDFCQKVATVDRCSPGFIVRKNSIKHHAIKIVDLTTYIQVKVSGESAVQIINIYCTKEKDAQEKTIAVIERWAQKQNITLRK